MRKKILFSTEAHQVVFAQAKVIYIAAMTPCFLVGIDI